MGIDLADLRVFFTAVACGSGCATVGGDFPKQT
jgi:hypothetical protein